MKRFLLMFAIVTLSAIALVACSKDEDTISLNATSVELYAYDTHFITTNASNVSFSSENPYIATVNSTTGEVTAMTIGKTVINVTSDQGKARVMVNVKAKYNTYEEPCTDFSKTKKQIIAMFGTPDTSTDSGIMYVHNKTKHYADMYLFNNNNAMSSSAAIIPQDYAVEAMNFLLERYLPLGVEDGTYMFVNGASLETITMGVAMSKMSGYTLYSITYLPYTSNTRSIASAIDNIKIDETILEKFAEYKE